MPPRRARRSVVACKPRAPLQANVGSKTRSAGRAPSPPLRRCVRAFRNQLLSREVQMEVVVTSRHCDVTERFREHASEKLAKLEKHDHRIIRVHVEVDCEPNPRQHDKSVHIELTAFSKGPVIRAEAAADHQMAALDLALDKM